MDLEALKRLAKAAFLRGDELGAFSSALLEIDDRDPEPEELLGLASVLNEALSRSQQGLGPIDVYLATVGERDPKAVASAAKILATQSKKVCLLALDGQALEGFGEASIGGDQGFVALNLALRLPAIAELLGSADGKRLRPLLECVVALSTPSGPAHRLVDLVADEFRIALIAALQQIPGSGVSWGWAWIASYTGEKLAVDYARLSVCRPRPGGHILTQRDWTPEEGTEGDPGAARLLAAAGLWSCGVASSFDEAWQLAVDPAA